MDKIEEGYHPFKLEVEQLSLTVSFIESSQEIYPCLKL